MKSPTPKDRTKPPLSMLLALLLIVPAWPYGNPSAISESRVELTKFDLFALPAWQDRAVTVDGFALEMSQPKAEELAKSKGLRLAIAAPMPTAEQQSAPCMEGECQVYKANGDWVGLDLVFDHGHIAVIKVSVPVDADPEVKSVSVVQRFRGRTYELFKHYSDQLRTQILGEAEPKKIPTKIGGRVSNLTNVEYDYPQLGIIVHFTIDTRDNPPKPFDLEFDFVRRQRLAM